MSRIILVDKSPGCVYLHASRTNDKNLKPFLSRACIISEGGVCILPSTKSSASKGIEANVPENIEFHGTLTTKMMILKCGCVSITEGDKKHRGIWVKPSLNKGTRNRVTNIGQFHDSPFPLVGQGLMTNYQSRLNSSIENDCVAHLGKSWSMTQRFFRSVFSPWTRIGLAKGWQSSEEAEPRLRDNLSVATKKSVPEFWAKPNRGKRLGGEGLRAGCDRRPVITTSWNSRD